MRFLLLFVTVIAASHAAKRDCMNILMSHGLSKNFNETVAHAIHSMTVEGLRMFTKSATVDNGIPTVNHNIMLLGKRAEKVLPYAPAYPLGSDFRTDTMNTIDKILSNLGNSADGLGKNWSPIERVAHTFHMMDLWTEINEVYNTMTDPPPESVCRCLLDTRKNGIYKAVEWVANHYETGTPITLLNRPIPKLQDAKSWAVWKKRLLYYYESSALWDAATYLRCVTVGMK